MGMFVLRKLWSERVLRNPDNNADPWLSTDGLNMKSHAHLVGSRA